MKKLHRYVFMTFFKSVITVQLFMAVIVMAVNLLQHSKLMGEYNVGFTVIFNYELLVLPYTLYLYMPVSTILSILMTMILLLKNNELLAYITSGGRVRDMLYPFVAMGILLTILLVFMADYVNPKTLVARELYSQKKMEKRTIQINVKLNDVWLKDKNNRLVHINNIDPVNRVVLDVEQYFINDNFEVDRLIKAERAEHIDGKWKLINVEEFEFEKVPKLIGSYPSRLVDDDLLSDMTSLPVFKPKYLSIQELNRIKTVLEEQKLNAGNYHLQIMQKYAHSTSVLIIILLIFPLCINLSRHFSYIKTASMGLSAGMGFWIIMSSLYTIGKTGALSPFVANFIAHIVFGALSIFLIIKKQNPSD